MISIIGDVLIDEYIYGNSVRLSPEAPVPVVKFSHKETKPGGAGNVYENIKSLTNNVTLCTSSKNLPVKQRIICDNHYITRIDYNDDNTIWNTSYNSNKTDIFVISDYNKGSISTPIPSDILIKPTIVDPKKYLSEYSGCFCIKPNKLEFELYAGKWNSIDELSELMKRSRKNLKIDHLVVTLGPDGVAYYGEDFYYIPSPKQEAFDVTGAGDTFLAVMSVSLYNGNSMIKSIETANKASGIAVSHKGTYVIKPEDIESEVVVFTNGCFDILHPGHIEYLKKSKELGGKLIVGINSDRSVRMIKGDNRPINNQEYRKYMLESLSFVDEVIIFDEETPIEIIKKIKPNIITKGGDYHIDNVVGNELAKVVIIPFVNGYSTTKTINRIKNV